MSDRYLSAHALVPLLRDLPSDTPLYRALADRLRLLAIDGRIPPDTRLPSERDLAQTLGASRTTVSQAYAALRTDGFLSSRRGSGSLLHAPGSRPGTLGPDVPALDLTKATMPAASQLAAAAAAAAADLPRHLLRHDYDPVGLPALRQALADRYTGLGLPTAPEQIMVTLGAQHAIGLVASTHVRPGDRAVVEMPTYPHALDALVAAGGRPVAVPVDARTGWDADALLRAVATGPAVAHLMPDHHNPTGAIMPDELRTAVCHAAARSGAVVVVDETTAELDIDRPDPWTPFARHAAEGTQVVTIGSVGKTLWGGLRLGWVRADVETIARLVAARHVHDLGTPILEQLVLLHALPHLADVAETRRAQLRASRDHLTALLAQRLPTWDVPHVHGGLALWVGLGEAYSSRLALAARERGLAITAGPRFGTGGEFERHLRVPITAAPEVLDEAVDILARAWDAVAASPARPGHAFVDASVPV
ncbi:GntR family transcriptional regulator [Flavimobilis soli]|uniref:GntR family transcriptional regulator n=1 Tax=Flavimobilis soli TaxID=442709 RepID=A0A2A9EAU6_9MICO|nr:PLP-dependent aminotransferase family protein [Flavimobilis soli]PFG35776.1 GntR family transcriptional regulator [Flavimobilis soli]